MPRIKTCSHCGIPIEFSKSNVWNNDGTIKEEYQSTTERSLFYETEALNSIFRDIEKLLELPIDRIIMECKRRNTLDYLSDYLSGIRGFLAHTLFRKQVYESIANFGPIFGFGHIDLLKTVKGERLYLFGRDIYNMPLMIGDLMATFNAMEDVCAEVEVEERDGGYFFNITPSDKPEFEFASRLQVRTLPPVPGNISYECCPECGVPLDLKNFNWDFERSVITDTSTGRRMVSLNVEHIDAVFRELEAELGEDVVRIIIHAQRSYTRNILTDKKIDGGFDYFKWFFAIRGTGNLVRYDLSENSLTATVENAGPHLLVAGILQGIFEAVTGIDSEIEYEMDAFGVLKVTVKAL